MGRVGRFLAAAALVMGLPAAAAAQSASGVQAAPPALERLQHSYVFLGDKLIVTVAAAEAPGSIQVLRGEEGRLDVSGRALGAPPAAGLVLDQAPELTLAAAGASRVDYILVVPASARVTLRLPGQPPTTLGTLARTGSWSWSTVAPGTGSTQRP